MSRARSGKGGGPGALARIAAERKAASLARKKKRGEALVELIARRKERIVEDFYDIGEALRALLREQLYLALGHATFGEMLDARGLVGLSQAKKLVEVVERIPRDEALRAGLERSYALVAYAAATPAGDDSAAALLAADARIGGKPASKATVREIAAATRAARPKRPPTPAVRARAKAEREAVAIVRGLWRKTGGPVPKVTVEKDSVVARWPLRSFAGKRRD